MHRNARRGAFAVGILLLLGVPALAPAEEVCSPSDTIAQCNQKIRAASRPSGAGDAASLDLEDKAAGAMEAERKKLAQKNTGDSPAVFDIGNASLNDFLSILRLALDTGSLDAGGNQEQIALEYSPGDTGRIGDFKAGLTLQRPVLLERLREAIGDDTVADALEDELSTLDDARLTLSYNYIGRAFGLRWGRSDALYADLIETLIAAAKFGPTMDGIPASSDPNDSFRTASNLKRYYLDGVLADNDDFQRATFESIREVIEGVLREWRDPAVSTARTRQVGKWIRGEEPDELKRGVLVIHRLCTDGLPEGVSPRDPEGWSDENLKDFSACLAEGFRRAHENDELKDTERKRSFERELQRLGLFKAQSLINNQPQFVFEGSYRWREELAGPDEYMAKLSWEMGVGNRSVNDLAAFLDDRACAGSTLRARYRSCISDVAEFLNQDQAGDRLGWRLALHVTYEGTRDLSVPVANQPEFELDDNRSLIGSLSLGKYLDAGGRSRIDLSLNVEDVSDDEMRQDRQTANLTFAQQVSDGLVLSVGFLWANHPEFRGEVDRDLSARAGLNYKLGKP